MIANRKLAEKEVLHKSISLRLYEISIISHYSSDYLISYVELAEVILHSRYIILKSVSE